MKNLITSLIILIIFSSCELQVNHRKEISLNGVWQIAKTDSFAEIPSEFKSKVPVPGLIDMTYPKLDEKDTGYNNSIYWYRRTFSVKDLKGEVVQLKINKAKYHTWVYVNRQLAGENVYNFTPSEFDLKPFLNFNNKENELIIAVGCRNNLPDTVTNGGDFEKTKYIPGIYDDVKIIVSGYPFISNVQTVPDIKNGKLRVLAEIATDNTARKIEISYVVREAASKKVVERGSVEQNPKDKAMFQKADFLVNMDLCQLWSPENPFLYDLELNTSGDNSCTRFGMRTFETSKDSGVFLLNGKPYYMRGTNVCIFRFFEDPNRNGLPWDSKWITTLHERFKEMHWNSIRYCIGFPPERWYEIADSLGFLIQDEFPIWTGGNGGFETLLKGITSNQLSAEYLAWMRERWNHPCVVVWDAQNESVNDTTGKAIDLVRYADLSNRPWDNGWAAPNSVNDAIESHPYLFSRYMNAKPGKDGYLKELFQEIRIPRNDPNEHSPSPDGKLYTNPIILNEYGWLWLNRNGSTTTLTDQVYANVFPEADTYDKRLEAYAKNLGILTEYWRAHRKAGAVMHFCGLGYSRPEKPRGQTSDNFTDIQRLRFEPFFYKYLKPAFSPVGIMADFWGLTVENGQKVNIHVNLINDTYELVEDTLRLNILRGDEMIISQTVLYKLDGLQKKMIEIPVTIPDKNGKCRLEAGIVYKAESVKSIREFLIQQK
jgi:beta-galactosidase